LIAFGISDRNFLYARVELAVERRPVILLLEPMYTTKLLATTLKNESLATQNATPYAMQRK